MQRHRLEVVVCAIRLERRERRVGEDREWESVGGFGECVGLEKLVRLFRAHSEKVDARVGKFLRHRAEGIQLLDAV